MNFHRQQDNDEEQFLNDNLELAHLFNVIYSFTYKKQKRTFSVRHCPICYCYIQKNNVILSCTHNCCFDCFYIYAKKSYESRIFPICFICRKNIDELEVNNEINKQKIKDIRRVIQFEPRVMVPRYTIGYLFVHKKTALILQYLILFWIIYKVYENIKNFLSCYIFES